MTVYAYSFLDTQASISGPGGSFSLGAGAGAAEEGISIAPREDKGSLTIGADGTPMHQLHADNSAAVTVRLLKTSPVNRLLMQMYNFQKQSSANWGQNLVTVENLQLGDQHDCIQCSFQKTPDLSYGKTAGNVEWQFLVGIWRPRLGSGAPALGS